MEEMLIAHGCGPVAGVDEAGRGACAGPLTIAACILPDVCIPDLAGLTDSKKLTPARRERLFPLIQEHAVAWSIVHFSATEVDEIGIQRANIEGMRRAVARLNVLPGYVLTDGFPVPGLPMPSLSVLKGDANVSCIAAASVLAKVSRDHIMVGYDEAFPEYGFAGHKGYATASHQAAMEHYGVSPIHRMSYANVAKAHSIAGMR
ncbi:ribonuclease HII [Lawsonella clevelandensis]|nr:ribonuclease HII [Lawsonella clevelandensis]ALE34216.1 ribonuclease HII [Lawsonella clevelandensis]